MCSEGGTFLIWYMVPFFRRGAGGMGVYHSIYANGACGQCVGNSRGPNLVSIIFGSVNITLIRPILVPRKMNH